MFVGVFQDGAYMPHVGRKGTQVRLDRLFVPDVREDGIEHGDIRVVVSGNVQTGLRHHGQDSDRLQGDRLAAHVGTGNHERSHGFAYFQVQRNDRFALVRLLKDGMPCVAQDDAAVGIQPRRRGPQVDR